MPDELSGVNIPVPNVAGQVKDQLSLVDLVNRLKAAPVDLQIKQSEAVLRANEVDQIPVANAQRQADLATKLNDVAMIGIRNAKERVGLALEQSNLVQKQNEIFLAKLKALPDAFNQSPEMGQTVLDVLAPGSKSQVMKDGTVGVAFVTPGGKVMPFTFDPKNVADPAKRQEIAQQWRKTWTEATKDFKVADESLQAAEQAVNFKTGAGDVSLTFAVAKAMDPNSVVRDGEREVLVKTQNIPDWLYAKYQQGLTSGAPFYTDEARKNLIDVLRGRVDILKNSAVTFAKGVAPIIGNVTAREAFLPVSRLTTDQIFGDEASPTGPAGTPLTPSKSAPGPRPSPIEAGVLPTGQTPEKAPPIIPYDEKIKRDLLVRSKGRK